MKKIILVVTFFLLSSISMANELQARKDINKQVKELFLNQKYSELEVMVERFREEELRTSSGLWMLTLFYGAIGEINSYKEKGPQVWISSRKSVDSWISKYPKSPTPYIVKSIILKDEAWSIRGNGYARSVKPEAWKPFHKKVEESRVVLEDSIDVSSQDPHWYVVMANIATIQSWKEDKFESLINDGLAKNQYYFQLYFDVMNYYTPRWHGNAEKIEAFANQAADRTKVKEGAGMYARIYWAASQSHFGGRIFENSNVRWELMSKGISDVLQKYPDQWNINNFALFSCLAKDKQKTKALISMIDTSPIEDGWLGNIKNYEYCKNWSLQ